MGRCGRRVNRFPAGWPWTPRRLRMARKASGIPGLRSEAGGSRTMKNPDAGEGYGLQSTHSRPDSAWALRAAGKGRFPRRIPEKHPSGVKAHVDLAGFLHGLNPVSFTGASFSAACKAPPLQSLLSIGRFVGLCRRAGCWALVALAPLALAAQEVTLHVDVELVNVFVNVTDRNEAI